MKGVYDIAKTICNERPRQVDSVRDKQWHLLTKESEVRARWNEHFCEVLNRPNPPEIADVQTQNVQDIIVDEIPPSYEEIRKVLKELKNGKAPEVDNITVEFLWTDHETSTRQIQDLLRRVWTEEKAPTDWKRGLILKLPKKGTWRNRGTGEE